MKKYNVEMESSALLKYTLKVEAKIPSDLSRGTCFDTLLSKSWIKLIHRSVVERKLRAENDKEVLVGVLIQTTEIGFQFPSSGSMNFPLLWSLKN